MHAALKVSNMNKPSVGVTRLWDRLDLRYGSPEMVETALKKKLEHFPRLPNRDHKKLFDLAEINSVKKNPSYSLLISYYDTSSGLRPIIQKLPHGLQEKWTSRPVKYKKDNRAVFPVFQ